MSFKPSFVINGKKFQVVERAYVKKFEQPLSYADMQKRGLVPCIYQVRAGEKGKLRMAVRSAKTFEFALL